MMRLPRMREALEIMALGAIAAQAGPTLASAATYVLPVVLAVSKKPVAPERRMYPVGARPREIAVADVDRDGRLDVIVANSGAGSLTVLRGGADGHLSRAAGSPLPGGHEPADVDAADVDGDGDADLIVANHETPRITVLLNDGRGGFKPAPGSPIDTGARPHVHGLATADFDHDGWTDVAVDAPDLKQVRVVRGSPHGFRVVVGVPVGTMPYYRLGVLSTGGGPVVLVPGHGNNTVRVIRQEGGRLTASRWPIPLRHKPWMVVGDDLNGDRRPDIVVVHENSVSIWLAVAKGFTAAPGSPFPVPGATEVATGDLDTDGMADVAIGPWDGNEVVVVTGGTFRTQRVHACGAPTGLAIADLNGDHTNELLVACRTENRLAVVSFAGR